jgi:NADPH2:quinone reductase
MRAVCRTSSFAVEQRQIPVPDVTPEHLVVRVSACGVNPGDKAWIAGFVPDAPESLYDVCGVSASGLVVDVGEGVPSEYLGRKIAAYRSLKASRDCVGTWCEFARLHYLTCALLPDGADDLEYSGSLVNSITAYVFLDQIIQAGHRAVVCTAGTSAIGRALLGVCQARNFPIISLVRTESGRTALSKLGAQHVFVIDDAGFDARLQGLSGQLNATAVFDGVGGVLVGRVAKGLPRGATVYCYGFLAGGEILGFPSSLLLVKSLTLTSFGIFLSPMVRDSDTLRRVLSGLQQIIGLPHFRTEVGRVFGLEAAADALQYDTTRGRKAVIRP